MPGENGPAMLRRMRRNGSRARFLVVTSDPTDDVRAASVSAGAMACLAKPVEAGILLDFLRSRTTGLAAQGEPGAVHDVDDLQDEDLDADLMDGHPEVASICRAIAADARRGVMAHARVVELQAMAHAG
jgi:DNA-binding NarL/FixJ family response regulator